MSITIKTTDIDFRHRLTYKISRPLELFDLYDAIGRSLDQANGVISLLQFWHNADANDEVSEIDPNILFFCLESVTQNLADIRAISDAFYQAAERLNTPPEPATGTKKPD